jgi:hypothetical protein
MRVHSPALIGGLLAVLAVSGSAYGDISFNFDALNPLDGSARIQSYMTDVYNDTVAGGTVAVSGAVSTGDGIGIGKLVGRHFAIQFSEAITGVGFDGWVLWETLDADFRVVALDQSGQEMGLLYSKDHSGWEAFNVPWLGLGDGVYGLKFTDHGLCDIGVDNLVIATANSPHDTVSPVPAPGAGLLLVVGLGLTGWMKRRLA